MITAQLIERDHEGQERSVIAVTVIACNAEGIAYCVADGPVLLHPYGPKHNEWKYAYEHRYTQIERVVWP